MQKNFSLVLLNQFDIKSNSLKNNSNILKMQLLKSIIKNANTLRDKIAVIKLPSCVILNNNKLDEFIENLSVLSECGLKAIVVHDFKDILELKADEFGLNHNGYLANCLPDKAISIYEMILAGHVSKYLVNKFNLFGVKSLGISGKDGQMVVTKNVRKLKATNDLKDSYISEPITISPEILLELDEALITPVISPVGCSENGSTSVVEVDKLVAMLAVSLEADYVVYMDEAFDDLNQNVKIKHKDFLQSSWPKNSNNLGLLRAARYAHENCIAVIHLSNPQVENALFSSFFD